MFVPFFKYSLVTILALTGTTSLSVEAPKREDTTTSSVAIESIPIFQDWKSRFIQEDTSITKFVSKRISLSDREYAPPDLVEVG